VLLDHQRVALVVARGGQQRGCPAQRLGVQLVDEHLGRAGVRRVERRRPDDEQVGATSTSSVETSARSATRRRIEETRVVVRDRALGLPDTATASRDTTEASDVGTPLGRTAQPVSASTAVEVKRAVNRHPG